MIFRILTGLQHRCLRLYAFINKEVRGLAWCFLGNHKEIFSTLMGSLTEFLLGCPKDSAIFLHVIVDLLIFVYRELLIIERV